jgi:hypothetical protein
MPLLLAVWSAKRQKQGNQEQHEGFLWSGNKVALWLGPWLKMMMSKMFPVAMMLLATDIL